MLLLLSAWWDWLLGTNATPVPWLGGWYYKGVPTNSTAHSLVPFSLAVKPKEEVKHWSAPLTQSSGLTKASPALSLLSCFGWFLLSMYIAQAWNSRSSVTAEVILATTGFRADSRDLNMFFLTKGFSHALQVAAIIRAVTQHFQKFDVQHFLTCCSFPTSLMSNCFFG